MVVPASIKGWARQETSFRAPFFSFERGFGRSILLSFLLCWVLSLTGCATGGSSRLKASRESFANGDVARAEAALYSSGALGQPESRLQQLLWLASLASAQAQFEKSILFLNRARDLAKELRSDRGSFEIFSRDYKSNPLEFSYLHYLLVVSNLALADQGRTDSWEIPELRSKDGEVLIPAQKHESRVFSSREIADFRSRARAELKAWDSFLVILKRTYPGLPYYQDDVFAKILGSAIHGESNLREDKRTGELLAQEGLLGLTAPAKGPPDHSKGREAISDLLRTLRERAALATRDPDERLILIETGVIPEYKEDKVVIGLSTLFDKVEDPGLRRDLERVGFQILLQTAPEFGLVAFTGAIAGAVTSDREGSPTTLTQAIDRSYGFEIGFPSLDLSKHSMGGRIYFTDQSGVRREFAMNVLSPLQEILSHELRVRQQGEWGAKAVKIGLQYLGILIPAVLAYRDAVRENNWLKRLAVLAGYFMAKKALDRANAPDLRSWSLLPQSISGSLIRLPPGLYEVEYFEGVQGREQGYKLGSWNIKNEGQFLIHHRVLK